MSHRPTRRDLLRARIRPRELDLLRAAARQHDTTVSDLVRDAALREARRILAGGEP